MSSSAPSQAFTISDSSHTGEARRAAATFSHGAGLSDTASGKVAIAVNELATNILKHAGSGTIIFRGLEQGAASGVEIIALDNGPGIPDLEQSMRDGFSTAGSSGTGMGSLKRLASVFDIFTSAKSGTAVLAQVWTKVPKEKNAQKFKLGAVCVPLQGEQMCGDGWAADIANAPARIMIADGLGHGAIAATASSAALRVFGEQTNLDLSSMMQYMHGALKNTRGAAVTLVQFDPTEKLVRCVGVGNVSGMVWTDGKYRSLVSHNGTVGAIVHKVQEFSYPWCKDALLILHSDGISTKWKLEDYAGLHQRHPSLIAGVIYRDFRRERDDASVVVVRAET